MNQGLRKTGIDLVGSAAWGTHFCQFYRTKQDLLDILVPYFACGLESNELCIWVTAEPLAAEEARVAMGKVLPDFRRYEEKGQIEILPHSEWYLKEGVFDGERVLQGWVDKLNHAQAAGYDGLRLTGNTFWLEKANWKDFVNYEAAVDRVVGNYCMLALCTYSLDKCGVSEVIDTVRNHEFALIKQGAAWELIESRERGAKDRARLVAMLEATSDFVASADPQGRILYFNSAARRMLGLGPDDDISSLCIADTHPEWAGRLVAAEGISTAGNSGQWRGETAFLHRDGTETPVSQVIVAHRGPDGAIEYYSTFARDITERKRAEAERERLIAELEARNAELERFTYAVSHDLKSPLITIRSFVGFVEDDVASGRDENLRADLGRISNAAETMGQLLDEILELSRVGRMFNPPTEVSMAVLAREAVELLSGSIAERDVDVHIAANLPIVCGDGPRLREVVQNLIENAVKFMGAQPHPQIELGAREERGQTIFYVRDNGMGIDPAYHDRIFRLFDKLDPKTEGTGIGPAPGQTDRGCARRDDLGRIGRA